MRRLKLQQGRDERVNSLNKLALRENSWKSTPIEGVAGNLVIQQERPPNETVAKSPSIRLFSAFVCPPRFSDLRSPPTSGRGRFGHLLHLVDRSRANPWRKESAYRASSDQVSKAPDPALIVHRQVFDSMIDAYLRRVPSPLLRTNRTQPHRCRGCHPKIGTGRRPHGSESSKDRKCCKTGERPIKQASRRIPAQSQILLERFEQLNDILPINNALLKSRSTTAIL